MNIDYTLLDKQVKDLLNLRFNTPTVTKKHKDSLDGIIELLEAIQDRKDNSCKKCIH